MTRPLSAPATSPDLAPIRAAHVARITAWWSAAERRSEPEGMPFALWHAGCWLVANGWDGEACAAELACHEGPKQYRMFLENIDPAARLETIAAGHAALFGGRHPICGPDVPVISIDREAA